MPRTLDSDPLAPTAFHYRKPIRGSLVWWLRFLGIAAFLIVLVIQLPRSQAVHLERIDVRWLGLCMLLTGAQLLLETLVWHWLMSAQKIPHPYPKTLVAYLAAQYLGLVTPGHVGEFLAAGYISMNTGITFGYALSSVVVKKALFWITTIAFGIWGVPLLADVPVLQGVQQMVWASVVILVALSAGITIWVLSLRRLTRKWEKLSPWQIDMTEFWAGIRQLASPKLIPPLLVAGVAFSLLFLQLHAVLHAMGIALPLATSSRIMALSRIAARLVPISVVGFGSKDAAVIMLLERQGISLPVGLTATVLLLVCSYLITLVLSGICWWVKPLMIRRAAPANS